MPSAFGLIERCTPAVGVTAAFLPRDAIVVTTNGQIAESLGTTIGEPVEVVTELTWQWALGAFLVLGLAWALSLWWLRGMV